MSVRVITPPSVEPVSVATAKAHLRVDSSAEDTLIGAYITAAREKGEQLARRAFINQTLEAVYDNWPDSMYKGGLLWLPRPPFASLTSVKYMDANGVEHSWTDYQVDARQEPARLFFNSVPSEPLFPSGAIAVRYTAGYGATAAAVPAALQQAILATVAAWYEMRDIGTLPASARAQFMSYRAAWF